MVRAVSFGAAMASLLVLGNCAIAPAQERAAAPEHYVSASSSATADTAAAQTYALAPMDSSIAPTDADFLEYAAYVERALALKGLARATPGEQPDLLILLRYGTGGPEKLARVPDSADFDHLAMTAQGAVFSNAEASSGKSSEAYGSSGRVTGSLAVINSDMTRRKYTTYTHFILLDGYVVDPARDSGAWEKVFETDIGSTGATDNLQQVFPYMIAATLDTIATDTGDVIRTTISESDDRVKLVRGGM